MSKPARPRTPAPVPALTPAERGAITRARSWLLAPRSAGTRSEDAYHDAAQAALAELLRLLNPDPVPQPPAEHDLPPIAAALGGPPVWVSTGTTGMFPVLARRTLGLFEEYE